MRIIITTLFCFCVCTHVSAQSCPVINGSFATALLFDPNWTLGCTSGTSCSGGTVFDNRATCESTTGIDACAPAPSCGLPANNASDIWFKFYATATTATITSNPSVSMISAIQAFSVDQTTPTCASLMEIGCNVSTGVNSVSSVSLTGLTVGQLYYYRVFGSAANAAQTTGTFCFCGSAGLSNAALAANLASFSASRENNNINVRWSTSAGSSAIHFEVERSFNGVHFSPVAFIPANANTGINNAYLFTDPGQYSNRIFYRLKSNQLSGQPEYSRIITLNNAVKSAFDLQENLIKNSIAIEATKTVPVLIINSVGAAVMSKTLQPGLNQIDLRSFSPGMYFIKDALGDEVKKFIIRH